MLQAIRSKASSFVVKILFSLLIFTFGVWGIGDIFLNRGPDTTVATVGDRDITADQLGQAVQASIQRLSAQLGHNVDAAQAKKMGVVTTSLQDMISTDILSLEMERLGLRIGDTAVRDAIISNSSFHNAQGQFDRNLYNQLLAANHLTESQFEEDTRSSLLQAQLLSAITDGVAAPQALAIALYRYRNERRVADFVLLPASAAGTIGTPSDQQIEAYYKAHDEQFRAPERRNFTLATLTLKDVAASVTVTDDVLERAFKDRQDEFRTPEQRHLEQMLLPDEATAKKAEAELAAGKDFATVAKDVAKVQDPSTLDLGWVSNEELPQELGDAAFALKEGGTTKPIKSAFGWHILRLEGVKAATQKTFAQAKDQLKKEVVQDRAGDRIADLANHIDDAIAGGASFASVVSKFGLKTTTIADIDDKGNGADGKPVDLPKPPDAIVHAAFRTNAGQMSSLDDLGNDGYFLVHVDKVTPAAAKPLAEVHDQVVQDWQDAQRQAALQKLAQTMADQVDAGKSLKDVAAAHGLVARTSTPFLRTGGDARVPASLVAKLFETKPGKAIAGISADNVMVAQLNSIVAADPGKELPAVQQVLTQLATSIQSDLVQEYAAGLRKTFPVEINQENVDRLM
ncbi:MAG TPA: SurA N-terminal domain-containing protein [Stellaceae bacterium]|nr:SurA N-terminal domain-containing protein [Stellaceae bacterium]